jgi:predicted metalloprotease with PDZ domain
MASPEPSLSYTISPDSGNKNKALKISLRFKGSITGRTELSLPAMLDQEGTNEPIEILSVTNSRRRYFSKKNGTDYIIEHTPGIVLTIHYRVNNQVKDSIPDHGEIHKAIINEKYFSVPGTLLCIIPNDNSHRKYDIKLQWKNINPLSILNSHGAQQPVQRFTTSLNKLQYAIFLGGDLRVHKIMIKNNPVYFGIRGSWTSKDEEVLAIIQRTVLAQRDYWNDHHADHYAISLLPLLFHSQNERSITGRGLYNSFVSFGANSSAFNKNDLVYLYNHELMHHWFGQVLQQKQPENAYKWFHEGFTDYFAYLVMLQSGVLQKNEWKNKLNAILANYYADSTNQWPNEKILHEYGLSPKIQQLPYQRGLIFALYLDEAIQYHTRGRSDLKKLVIEMLTTGNKEGKIFSPQVLLDLLHKETGSSFSEKYKNYIIEGRFIDMAAWEKISQKMDLITTDIFHLGFTSDRGITLNAVITSVTPGAEVAKAGLLPGDIMKGFSSNYSTVDSTTLIVLRGEEKIKFTYLPVKKMMVPQIK